jgi:hypothetical protein
MRSKLPGMLILGVGLAAWSCGGYDETSTDGDGSGGSAGSATGTGGASDGSGGSVTGAGGSVTGGGSGGLVTGSGGLVTGSGGLVTGSGGLVTGSGGLVTGSGGLVTGSGGDASGGDGSGGLVTGSGGDGSGGLVTGSGGLVTGSGGLVTGSGGLVTGSGGDGSGGLVTGSGGDGSGGLVTGSGGDGSGGDGSGGDGTGGATGIIGPCDLYAADNTPCVGAYSMVRVLDSTYSGPLYQVRRGGNPLGSGGETLDIGALPNGFADAATQDAFCAGQTCTVSILYDHSEQGNDLTVAPAGCYTGGDGAAAEPDYESSATGKALTASGNNVYGLYMNAHEGYRNNGATGTAEGDESQGVYLVADGTHYGVACCWDFGTASRDNCYGPTGMMATLLFGTAWWGRGEGNGPWMMGDFESGVWAGGAVSRDPGYGAISACDASDANCPPNNDNPSLPIPFAFGILETSAGQYALRMGDATSGTLQTAYDGAAPEPWILEGGIILGMGGDNSNWSWGTFFEGAITAGRPSLATQQAVYQNVQAARYGQ